MVTLNDIAAACDVSRTTVSRVLSQDPGFSVSPQTRELILTTAASMNYKPGQRKLKSKASPEKHPENADLPSILKIGMLNFDFKTREVKASDYYNAVCASVISALQDLDLAARIEFRYILKDSYEELIDLDALVILGKIYLDPDHPFVSRIRYKVSIDYISPENQFDSVRPDFYRVIQMAVEHFQANGHFDIGYIGGCDFITQFSYGKRERTQDIRQLAFRDYCLKTHVDPDSRIWITDTFSAEDGYRITSQLLAKHTLPDAILFGSDDLALGSYQAFHEHAIKIGEDVSIIGIDNMPFSRFLNPALTTIALNPVLVGRSAAYALASQILQGRNFPLTIHPPVELIERKSVTVHDNAGREQ